MPGLCNKVSEIEILKIIKIIDNKNCDFGINKEINNEYFIYANSDNNVVLLDGQFNPFMEIRGYHKKILNIGDQLQINKIINKNINIKEQDLKANKKTNKSKILINEKIKSDEKGKTESPKGNEKLKTSNKIDNLKIILCSKNYLYLTKINLKERKT